jgi:hypothetical protein
MLASQKHEAGLVRALRNTLVVSLGMLLLLLSGAGARAAGELEGELEIHSAYVVIDHGVVQLNAHIQYPLNDSIRSTLLDGVTLAFDLEVSLSRHRRLWFNAGVLDLTVHRELSYHAVTDRYVLRDAEGRDQESFPSADAAFERLGRVEDLPILVESQLGGDGSFQVAVRAGVRRGRLPDLLRTLVFWSDDWRRTSDWYTWTLTP